MSHVKQWKADELEQYVKDIVRHTLAVLECLGEYGVAISVDRSDTWKGAVSVCVQAVSPTEHGQQSTKRIGYVLHVTQEAQKAQISEELCRAVRSVVSAVS